MEMHLFVAMLLRMFDLEMLDQVPPPVSPIILHALLHTCTCIYTLWISFSHVHDTCM